MIQRFNFFDVYAYQLPGATLLGLFWLPFLISRIGWTPYDFSSAVLFLVAGYIVGHVLYHPAKEALPVEANGEYRPAESRREKPSQPSNYVLDAAERTFTPAFKERLQDLINQRFKDAVKVNVHFDWKNADEEAQKAEAEQRSQAFLLCRSALLAGKISYGEQFEGLYQFLRCLVVVFALGCAYHTGWALALWKPDAGPGTMLSAILVAMAIAGAAILDWRRSGVIGEKRSEARGMIGLLIVASYFSPFVLQSSVDLSKGAGKSVLFAGMALMDAFIAWRCFAAYKPFAWEFARAIYRDFYAFASQGEVEGKRVATAAS